jgi:hypothetical protein
MARLNVFVVSFILLRLRRNAQRAHTKEHFSMLGYSAALLEPTGLLHGRLDKASSGGWLPN